MSTSASRIREPSAQSVTFAGQAMRVLLVDGRTLSVPLDWYPRLWHGSPTERKNYEIIGDGAYIHWPDLDEDLTVVGMLEGRKSAERKTSIDKWLATRAATNGKKQKKLPRATKSMGRTG